MKDLSDIDVLKSHLRASGLRADHGLGQNFLVDNQILKKIEEASEISEDEQVLEIGPGPGALSQVLASRTSKLLALELDEKMIQPWTKLLQSFPGAEILHQDALTYTPQFDHYKVIANIPYYITSPLLKHFLREEVDHRPEMMVFMIQKEVAERIVNEEQPTLLSWEVRLYADADIVCKVPPESFYPAPKVHSAVIRLRVKKQPDIADRDAESFFQMMGMMYRQPRKTLNNNWKACPHASQVTAQDFFASAGVSEKLRPHQLIFQDWKALFEQWKQL
jgi:16S rRNA (adenine1518-N6/adenine1519-N6)-dimethyltransferase